MANRLTGRQVETLLIQELLTAVLIGLQHQVTISLDNRVRHGMVTGLDSAVRLLLVV